MKNGILLATALIVFSACSPTPGPDKSIAGTILGAGWGAGSGAIVGNQVGDPGAGAAIGAGVGAAAGLMTGVGLDVAEANEIEQQREVDALKVQVAANNRALMAIQDSLDARDRKLSRTAAPGQVFFDKDRASLRSGAAMQLERLANTIKRNPYIGRVEIHGHTDISDDETKNQRVSEARARTVATFLANHGLSLDRMVLFAHGANRPLATNDTDEGRQLNRRVEIVLRK